MIAVVVVFALLLTACTGSPRSGGRWRGCDQLLRQHHVDASAYHGDLEVRCTMVRVPLDYRHPDRKMIGVRVVALHDARDTHPIGPLLANYGGPGEPGIDYLLSAVPELRGLLKHFDVVGFDPRGVGGSDPIRCRSNAQEDAAVDAEPNAATARGLAELKGSWAAFARACRARYGSTVTAFNTVNTARDMDRIRAALGAARITYLGYSYGTELGWVYLRLFPKRVRGAVLDGAFNPNRITDPVAQTEAQLRSFEQAFTDFARYCDRTPTCPMPGETTKAVLALRRRAQHQPIPAGPHRSLTLGLLDTGISQALYYSKSEWPALARYIVEAINGDGTDLAFLADLQNGRNANGTYTNFLDAFSAIQCNDTPPSAPSDATIRAQATRMERQHPIFGESSAGYLTACQHWPVPRKVPPPPATDHTAKILIIGGIHDPVTPYADAQKLTAALGDHAELLTWTGQGHTIYLHGNACVDSNVTHFLLTEELPPRNTTCTP